MKQFATVLTVLFVIVTLMTISVMAEDPNTETLAQTTAESAPETNAETTLDTAADATPETLPICTCDTIPTTKFCPACGGLHPDHDRGWMCTCGADVYTAYCPACGAAHGNHDGCWDCPTCDEADIFNGICPRCGAERPKENVGNTGFRINVDSLAVTLPIMGMGMLGIFLVIGVIAIAVMILQKLPEKKEEE